MSKQRLVSGLEAHLGYWVRFVSNHVSQAFTRKVEACGVTVAEWVLLRELLDTQPAAPSELAERLGMTRGAISKLVERLLQKELVARTLSETDRRRQSVSLTPAGRKLVPILAQLADDNDREFFGHWPETQRTELTRLLQELVHRHGWKDRPVD